MFVRDRRTKVDWAECLRVILDEIYPEAIGLRWVQDNLNTHTIGALYEAFAPEEAPAWRVGWRSTPPPSMAAG